jgi:hypothetical protein
MYIKAASMLKDLCISLSVMFGSVQVFETEAGKGFLFSLAALIIKEGVKLLFEYGKGRLQARKNPQGNKE